MLPLQGLASEENCFHEFGSVSPDCSFGAAGGKSGSRAETTGAAPALIRQQALWIPRQAAGLEATVGEIWVLGVLRRTRVIRLGDRV
jgi:hypothetical protein